ncbi:hypothetical protein BXQ17_06565 [Polaribacter sp. BM10]|uniref:hypothetical protein n=1 Tax=Polaribacter sp. BM10 TaxID=1529069 RepID=UPI00098ABA15|nr:hypothetical protein [Polaribacter sp. BM10]AQS93740.1 hypothetical protein BXQ17_06565 [Polaribacter sp. BM10]
MKKNIIVKMLLCFVLILGCSEDVDFDQIEDYTLKPSYALSLTYFTISPNNFVPIPGAPPITEISEKSDVKIFETNFIRQNLVQLDFDFEIINRFNRDFTVEISLLDENDNLIYQLNDLNVAANNLEFKQTEILNIESNPTVRNFTRVEVRLSLDDKTTPIIASDVGEIIFNSAATIHLEAPL